MIRGGGVDVATIAREKNKHRRVVQGAFTGEVEGRCKGQILSRGRGDGIAGKNTQKN